MAADPLDLVKAAGTGGAPPIQTEKTGTERSVPVLLWVDQE